MPAAFVLPGLVAFPGATALLVGILIGVSWWLVHLLFSRMGRDDSPAEPDAGHWGEDLPEAVASGAEPEDADALALHLCALAALRQVEERLVACPDVEAALASAVGAVRAALGSPAAAVWIDGIAESPGVAEVIGESSPPADCQSGLLDEGDHDAAEIRRLLAPWMGALGAGESVCIPDCAAEPDLSGRFRPGVGSLALVPFPPGGAVRGGLAVAWPSALEIGAGRLAVVRRLGATVGLAVEAARLRQELGVRQTQARVLVETGIALSGARDFHGTLDGIVHVVHDRLGYGSVAVLSVDEEKDELYVASMAGHAPAVNELRIPIVGTSVTATAAREQRTVNVPEVSDWPGYIAGSGKVRSELALPLLVDGKLVGVLDVESEQPAAFGVCDRATLETVASQATLVLAHSRLLAIFEERATRLETVDEMARAVSTTLDAHSLFQIVVEQVRATVGCDRATLVNFDAEAGEARLVAVSSHKPVAGLEPGRSWPLSELSDEVRGLRGAIYLSDLETEGAPGAVGAGLRGSGFRSLVLVPIRIDGGVAGVFAASSLRPGAFTRAQVTTLEEVAPHVSAALRNARLYEQVERSYQQLNQAHLQLVQSEQLHVLGEMASGVAHNFNNVLGAILGRAQLVRARVGDPRLAQEIAIIEQAATDGAATVRRLQEFTRLRTDREFVPVDLSQIARDALALTRPWWKDRADSSGVFYGVVTDLSDGAWVQGQAHELREVLMNVLLNAIEAMPTGGSLTVRGRTASGRVSLEISDTGVGMSEEVRSRIFHPFYSTKGPRGTGLGLSIAYGIVQRHEGELEIESRPGAGTTVRLSLPAGPPGEQERSAALALAGAPFQARVLVVEDELTVATLLKEILESAGYDVITAVTGREAVERLIETPIQLVLTDLGMPEMSGWELARHCRDLYPGVPVVLVTGWGVELDGDLVSESAVRGVVAKPFTVTDILETVSRVLEETAEERKAA